MKIFSSNFITVFNLSVSRLKLVYLYVTKSADWSSILECFHSKHHYLPSASIYCVNLFLFCKRYIHLLVYYWCEVFHFGSRYINVYSIWVFSDHYNPWILLLAKIFIIILYLPIVTPLDWYTSSKHSKKF